MICSSQYLMTIANISFTVVQLKSIVVYNFGFSNFVDVDNIWTYGVIVIIIDTLLAWVQNISSFSFSYAMSNFLMLCSCIVVCSYSVLIINENGIDKEVVNINTNAMWSMVGFSIYIFEGIGILMPVM